MDETIGLKLDVDSDEAMAASMRMDQLGRSVTGLATHTQVLDTSMAAVTKGKRDWGYATLQLAQTLDDAQYGIRGIVNNVPMLVSSLSMGAGVAGAAGVAMVAVNQLTQHWDELVRAFDTGGEKINVPIDRLKELTKGAKEAQEVIDRVEKRGSVGGWSGGPQEKEEYEKAKATMAELAEEKARRAALERLTGIKGEDAQRAEQTWSEALKRSGGGQRILESLTGALESQADTRDKQGNALVLDPRTGHMVPTQRLAGDMLVGAGGGDQFSQQFILKALQGGAAGRDLEAALRKLEEERTYGRQAVGPTRADLERALQNDPELRRQREMDAAVSEAERQRLFEQRRREETALYGPMGPTRKMMEDTERAERTQAPATAFGPTRQTLLQGLDQEDPTGMLRMGYERRNQVFGAQQEWRAAVSSWYDMNMAGADRGTRQMLAKEKAAALRGIDIDQALFNGKEVKGRTSAERAYIAQMKRMLGPTKQRAARQKAADEFQNHVNKFGEFAEKLAKGDIKIVL